MLLPTTLSDHQRHRFVYMISYPIVVSNNTPRRGVIRGSVGNYFIQGNWALRYTPVDLLWTQPACRASSLSLSLSLSQGCKLQEIIWQFPNGLICWAWLSKNGMTSSDFSSVSRERLEQLRKGLFENGKFRSCRLSIFVKSSVDFCVFPVIPSRYPPGIIGGCSLHSVKHTGEGIDEIGQLSLSCCLAQDLIFVMPSPLCFTLP